MQFGLLVMADINEIGFFNHADRAHGREHLVGFLHRSFATGCPDEFRGRIFVLDFVLFSLGFAVSNYFAGYFMDSLHIDPRTIAVLMGAYFFLPGVLWIVSRREATK